MTLAMLVESIRHLKLRFSEAYEIYQVLYKHTGDMAKTGIIIITLFVSVLLFIFVFSNKDIAVHEQLSRRSTLALKSYRRQSREYF